MDEEKKNNVLQLFKDNAKPKTPRLKSTTPVQKIEGDNNVQQAASRQVNQSIKGNGNIQTAGTVNLTIHQARPKTVKVVNAPPPGSIGAAGLLKEGIAEAFGKLGQEREKRVGKTAYSVMYSTFKKDFQIPKELPWTTIWNWPESRAAEIAAYLEEKHSQTIGGKIERAAKRPGYQHTRGHLFKREKELLAHLELTPDSPEVRAEMRRYFGTDSHKDMDARQHANWVAHLEAKVDQMYDAKN